MIIGISGKMGAGKDTLGMVLQGLSFRKDSSWYKDPLGYAKAYDGRPNLKGGWKIVKYADKLRQIAGILLGVEPEKFEDREFKLTQLGHEWDHVELGFQWEGNASNEGSTPAGTYHMTVRQFLQRLGTDALREGLHQNVWINALFADYKDQINYTDEEEPEEINRGKPNWIVTDVRFPDEADAIKARGGIVVRIDRPDNPHPQSTHLTETALDDYLFDVRIQNDKIEDLVPRAKALLKIADLRVSL